MSDGLAALRECSAPAAMIETIAASGLPAAAARGAVERGAFSDRLRRWLRPTAALTARELARLAAVAALAAEVASDEGGPDGARRFWETAMPWLGGRTPADWLARGQTWTIH